jgi:hypothetical protein
LGLLHRNSCRWLVSYALCCATCGVYCYLRCRLRCRLRLPQGSSNSFPCGLQGPLSLSRSLTAHVIQQVGLVLAISLCVSWTQPWRPSTSLSRRSRIENREWRIGRQKTCKSEWAAIEQERDEQEPMGGNFAGCVAFGLLPISHNRSSQHP